MSDDGSKEEPMSTVDEVAAADRSPMSLEVDAYIDQSSQWPEEMAALRSVLLDCGLDEQIKWRSPCFTHEGKNIAIMQEMKDFLSLMFFKGVLLDDPHGVLEEQGENTRSARRVRFTSVDAVSETTDVLSALIDEAIAVEKAGLEVAPPPELVLVDELQDRIDADPAFKVAFESLTPGRQREYNLHISSAKQSSTRAGRVEKLAPRILAGKGLRDR